MLAYLLVFYFCRFTDLLPQKNTMDWFDAVLITAALLFIGIVMWHFLVNF